MLFLLWKLNLVKVTLLTWQPHTTQYPAWHWQSISSKTISKSRSCGSLVIHSFGKFIRWKCLGESHVAPWDPFQHDTSKKAAPKTCPCWRNLKRSSNLAFLPKIIVDLWHHPWSYFRNRTADFCLSVNQRSVSGVVSGICVGGYFHQSSAEHQPNLERATLSDNSSKLSKKSNQSDSYIKNSLRSFTPQSQRPTGGQITTAYWRLL